jgi:hypothetical protein
MPLDAPNVVIVLPTDAGALIKVGCLSPPPIPVFKPAPIPVFYGYRVGDDYV